MPCSLLARDYAIKVGDTASHTKILSQDDVNTFGAMIGDQSPIHRDVEYAKGTIFGKPILQGNLTIS